MAFPIYLPDIHAIAVSVQHQPWFNTDPNPHKTNRRQNPSHPDHDSEFYTLQATRSTLSLRSLSGARLRRKVSAWSMRSSRTGTGNATMRVETQDTSTGASTAASTVAVDRSGSEESGRMSRGWRLREKGGRVWKSISRH